MRLSEPALVDEEPPDWAVLVVAQAAGDEIGLSLVDGRHPGGVVGELMIDGFPWGHVPWRGR